VKLKCFSPLRILTSSLFEETLGAFFFFLFLFSLFFNTFSLSFFYALSLEDLGVLMIFQEKDHFFKNFLFKWPDMECHGHDCGCHGHDCGYIGGGHILQNEVMHANIAKP
jgi:hypothetical protein